MSLSKNMAESIVKEFAGQLGGHSLTQVAEQMFIGMTKNDKLVCVSAAGNRLINSLQAEQEQTADGVVCKICALTGMNAELLRRNVKWAAPSAAADKKLQLVSGEISGQQLEQFAQQGIKPIFIMQTMDEKNYRGFLDKLTWLVVQNGYQKGYGADAGPLNTEEEIVGALVLGYSRITLDASSKVNLEIENLSTAQVEEKYAALPDDFRSKLEASYLEQKFKNADGGKIQFEGSDLKRIALTYVEIIVYAKYVHNTYFKNTPWPIDFVLSLQGAPLKLTTQARYLIVNELERLGARVHELL